MKVTVKDFAVSMEIKNKGIELDVYDNDGKHLGDLVVTKTKLGDNVVRSCNIAFPP